jgi:hypothetical protein
MNYKKVRRGHWPWLLEILRNEIIDFVRRAILITSQTRCSFNIVLSQDEITFNRKVLSVLSVFSMKKDRDYRKTLRAFSDPMIITDGMGCSNIPVCYFSFQTSRPVFSLL